MIAVVPSRIADVSRYSALFGPSGHESVVRENILRDLSHLQDVRVHTDAIGNLYVLLPAVGTSVRRTPVVLSAHMDEIGFVVRNISSGVARIRAVGSWRADALLGQRVAMRTRTTGATVHGIVGVTPTHWQSRADAKRVVAFSDLWVDCAEGWEDLAPGDFGTLAVSPHTVYENRVIGKALDNRAGCAALLGCLQALARIERPNPIIAIFTTQEELDGRGALHATHAVREMFRSVVWTGAAKCCVVDATFATDDGTRDDTKNCERYGPVALGRGPVVCPAGSTSIEAAGWLDTALHRLSIDPQITPWTETTATDADTLGTVPWLDPVLLSYPLRNMHSAVEMVDSEDVLSVSTVLATLCLQT